MVELGVNIDHVATLRQARQGVDPDIFAAAKVCEMAGAHQITVHLREDRRHIQDRDVRLLKEILNIRLNLEMAASNEIIQIGREVQPDVVCLVPERRQEITTEGGLNVAADMNRLKDVVSTFHEIGTKVSMFIDPEMDQVDASAEAGADYIELHTGAYANAPGDRKVYEISRIVECGARAINSGLIFNVGHGLDRHNLPAIAAIPGLNEANIGHSIVSRALFVGLEEAVTEILAILQSFSDQ